MIADLALTWIILSSTFSSSSCFVVIIIIYFSIFKVNFSLAYMYLSQCTFLYVQNKKEKMGTGRQLAVGGRVTNLWFGILFFSCTFYQLLVSPFFFKLLILVTAEYHLYIFFSKKNSTIYTDQVKNSECDKLNLLSRYEHQDLHMQLVDMC